MFLEASTTAIFLVIITLFSDILHSEHLFKCQLSASTTSISNHCYTGTRNLNRCTMAMPVGL